jgi:hypothetical protein
MTPDDHQDERERPPTIYVIVPDGVPDDVDRQLTAMGAVRLDDAVAAHPAGARWRLPTVTPAVSSLSPDRPAGPGAVITGSDDGPQAR